MKIKKLMLGELLDLTVRMYLGNYKLFLSLSLIALIPNLLLNLTSRPPAGDQSLEVMAFFFARLGVPLFVFFLVYALFTGAVVKAVERTYLEKGTTAGDSLRAAASEYPRLIGAGFLYGLAVIFGTFLLIIPGIYFALAYSLYSQAIMCEGLPAGAALKRSRALIKGSWWRVFGIGAVIGLLALVVQSLLAAPFSFMTVFATVLPGAAPSSIMGFVGQAGSAVASSLVAPLSIIGHTLLYYDLRIRREGFDMWLMADELSHSDATSK